MDIFIVSRGVPRDEEPLWGNFEYDQAEALRKLGHKVTILAIDGRRNPEGLPLGITHFANKGAYVYRSIPWGLLKYSPRVHAWFKRRMMLRLFKKVSRREGTPDVVYVHYLLNIHDSLYIRKTFTGPLIGIEHWSKMMWKDIPAHLQKMAREVYPAYDRLLTVSPLLQEAVFKNFGVQSIVVPDMVADDFIKARNNRLPDDTFTFCSIGRLVDWKNFDILLQAAKLLKDCEIDFRLTIIGDGPESKRLKEQINELGLENNVRMTGLLKREEIIRELSRSNAFVLPSAHETFGVVFIEAMAMGLPVIGSSAGGPLSIVNDSNGRLVEVGNVEKLAAAMEQMINEIDRYDSEKIAKDCRLKYSSEAVARRLEDIFTEAIANR